MRSVPESLPSSGVEIAVPAAAQHGEAPRWDDRTGELLWADVHLGVLHRWRPGTGQDRLLRVPPPLAAPAPGGIDGGYALLNGDGFGYLHPDGTVEQLASPLAGAPDMRMNDGRPDRSGRLWGDSIRGDGPFRDGALFCLEPGGSLRVAVEGLRMANGLDWSPDGRTMYLTDSAQGIDAFDFDESTGTLAGRRRLIGLPPGGGWPDGLTVDADGGIWVALYRGGAVHRYAPDGTLDHLVRLPVPCPTALAFGGPALRDLYITTTRRGSDHPLSGSVFVASPGVGGQPPTAFRQ